MIVVSKNIRHIRIFLGVPREGRQLSNDNAWSASANFTMCTQLFTANMCHLYGHAYSSLSSIVDSSLFLWSTGRCYVSLNEKRKRDILVQNELKNAEHLREQLVPQ